MKDFETIRKACEASSNIEKLAAKAGVDVETARNFYKAVSDKFGKWIGGRASRSLRN